MFRQEVIKKGAQNRTEYFLLYRSLVYGVFRTTNFLLSGRAIGSRVG